MFRGHCMLIRKLCNYLCAPANITENTVPVAISQRFHVEKITPSKNVLKITPRNEIPNQKIRVPVRCGTDWDLERGWAHIPDIHYRGGTKLIIIHYYRSEEGQI